MSINGQFREQISAAVDDELEESELQLVVRRMATDSALRAYWARYHLTSDVLRQHYTPGLDARFAERVAGAITAEPVPRVPRMRRTASLLKPLAGAAIAASVAAVAVLGVQMLQREAGSDAARIVAVSDHPQWEREVSSVQDWDGSSPEARSALNSYLLSHNGHSGSVGIQGVLPYVRIVGYAAGE